MMKLMHQPAVYSSDLEALDIGICKSGRAKDYLEGENRKKKARENEYLYGRSFWTDALFRDYSFNALYVDVVAGCVYVPCIYLNFGNTIFSSCPLHLRNSIPRGISDVFTRERCLEIASEDFGGHFRFWKELQKFAAKRLQIDSAIRQGELYVWQKHLEIQVNPETLSFVVSSIHNKLTLLCRSRPLSEIEPTAEDFWIAKFCCKLFSGRPETLNDRVRGFYNLLEDQANFITSLLDHEHKTKLKQIWPLLQNLANLYFSYPNGTIFVPGATLSIDTSKGRLVLQVMGAIKEVQE
jgi:hypothetical protein